MTRAEFDSLHAGEMVSHSTWGPGKVTNTWFDSRLGIGIVAWRSDVHGRNFETSYDVLSRAGGWAWDLRVDDVNYVVDWMPRPPVHPEYRALRDAQVRLVEEKHEARLGQCGDVRGMESASSVRQYPEGVLQLRRRWQHNQDHRPRNEGKGPDWAAAHNQLKSELSGHYCLVEWQETYADASGVLWSYFFPIMLNLGRKHGIDNVRMVMNFDS